MKRGVQAVNFICAAEVDDLRTARSLNASLGVLWQQLWAQLLPASCRLCGDSRLTRCAPHDLPIALCQPCRAHLPWLESACPSCAEPLYESALCGTCLRHPPAFQHSLVALRYEGVVARWISAFKYHGDLAAGRLLSQILAHTLHHAYRGGVQDASGGPQPAIVVSTGCASHTPETIGDNPTDWPQLLIPVPMYRNRLAQRGYNQAALVAADLSRALGIPWSARALQRLRHTSAQSELSEAQRRSNLAHAFAATAVLPVHVALVDDVVTTTSTVRACADTLAQAGVQRISVWALARTP